MYFAVCIEAAYLTPKVVCRSVDIPDVTKIVPISSDLAVVSLAAMHMKGARVNGFEAVAPNMIR